MYYIKTICALIVFASFALVEAKDDIKICLIMIVKNESKIIERCLNSAKSILDYVVITDTGSTDNTVQIIEDFLKLNKFSGKIFQEDWQNFGVNRSNSFTNAISYFDEKKIAKENLYFLLLDADMMLKVSSEFNKNLLVNDSYMIQQKSSHHTYSNLRLLKADKPWKCIGVTHEYWQCDQFADRSHLASLSIDDCNDGGCKADKFERDVRLLRAGLEKDPNNGRYKFYLAQCYMALKDYTESIKWFKARILQGGWNEEVWYSHYMIGENYELLNKWNLALQYYLKAYELNPERSEPLYKIAHYYRMHNQYNLAHLYAKMGAKIPFPKNQVLFISHEIYDYLFDEELSIASYYTPIYKNDGYEAAKRLIEREDIPSYIREQAIKNITFYN